MSHTRREPADLDNLKPVRKQGHENLTLFPLMAPDAVECDFLTLDETLSRGAVEISEVGKGGSVPELKLINCSTDRVLVVEGEKLVGFSRERKGTEGQIVHPWSDFPIGAEGGWADANYLTSLNKIHKIG